MSEEGTQLNDCWTLSYQGFGPWEIHPVVDEIYTIQMFWSVANHAPPASKLTVTTEGPREVIAEPVGNIRSILLFRTYTDKKPTVIEMGAPGMRVVYRFEVPGMSASALDHEWEELQLAAIGESCNSESWALSGVRLLDRTKKGKVAHRFEMWCRKEADDVRRFAQARADTHGAALHTVNG